MANRLFDLYATGSHRLSTLRKFLKTEYGKVLSLGNTHLILENKFYIGVSCQPQEKGRRRTAYRGCPLPNVPESSERDTARDMRVLALADGSQ
jgi:hypothetical protein